MRTCQYETTCVERNTCGGPMPELHAKPVIDGKFWIVEEDNTKIGVLKITEQKKYIFSSKDQVTTFDNKRKLVETFGKEFFTTTLKTKADAAKDKEVYGYPVSSTPHQPMFDVKRHLPLFIKSQKSKSVFCAGYYLLKFNKGWTKAFCPKLITIERYPYQGPFKTEEEMKQRLSHGTRED